MSVMKTADVNIFQKFLKKMYTMVYVFAAFCGCSIKDNNRRCNFALSHLKRALKGPVKTGLNGLYQVLLQTSLFKVQFSKTYLKTLSQTFFMNGRISGFCIISFNFSINQFLEYCDLTKVIAARLMTNFTFVLQRISKWKFVIIFCSTEVLFSRHSESNRTHIFLEQAVQSLQKISFYEYSGKNSQEGKCSSLRSRQSFRKKMYVMKSVLFSVKLWDSCALSVLSCIARWLLLCKQSNIA